MAAYLLNLVFSKPSGASSASGLFNSNSNNAPSKVWYTVAATPQWPVNGAPTQTQPVTDTPPLSSWTNPPAIPDDQLFLCNLGDDVYIRFVPDNSWGNSPSLAPTAIVTFGRPGTSGHSGDNIPSPFLLSPYPNQSNNPAPCNTQVYTFSAAANDGSFILYLGQPKQNDKGGYGSGINNYRVRLYTFIVGLGLTYNQISYQYSHDPEMGVRG
ncbi:MAG TPA: hypothetical protein VFL42_02840 [Terriglobales bacterium]|nr:hypothetical protein [Terriglobales bacterium]